MNSPGETVHGLEGYPDFAIHASTGVEEDAHAHRNAAILAEMRNRPGLSVFFKNEIVSREIRDVSAVNVRDGGDNIHKAYIDANLSAHYRRDCQDNGEYCKSRYWLLHRGLPR